MRILIFGKNDPVQTDIIGYLKNDGHQVIRVHNRNKIPSGKYDICVDTSTQGASLLRRGLNNLAGKIAHYILISSHRVYPNLPREAPWNPYEINIGDESGFPDLPGDVRIRREVERELGLLSATIMSWTILRPAIIETINAPDKRYTKWFVSRILDGGPVILPDDEDPLFRHVSSPDLAKAILTVAGQKEAFAQIIHVVDQGIFTFSSYAELIMRGLGKKVPIERVPATHWTAAGLEPPMGRHVHSSFIDDSQLLRKLGWEPADETKWVQEYAAELAAQPEITPPERPSEHALLDVPETPAGQIGDYENTVCFVGEQGEANSFRTAKLLPPEEKFSCLLKTVCFAMGVADEQFLLHSTPDTVTRILSHNALLELVDPGSHGLPANKLYLPVVQRPCGTAGCTLCQGSSSDVSRIDEDGYARSSVSLPPEHLVPVSRKMGAIALLAAPLACLMIILPGLLEEENGPVWIFGQRVDAALADLIIRDSNCPPALYISRTDLTPVMHFGENHSFSIQKARARIAAGTLAAPRLALNLSGARDGDNLLSNSLSDGGVLLSPFVKTSVQRRVLHAQLPLTAPGRQRLERALQLLGSWTTQYDLERLVQKVAIENYWDLFLPEHFRQPYLQLSGDVACES